MYLGELDISLFGPTDAADFVIFGVVPFGAMAVEEPGASVWRVLPRRYRAAVAALQALQGLATDIFWLQTLNVTKNYSVVRPRFSLPWRPLGLSAERGS